MKQKMIIPLVIIMMLMMWPIHSYAQSPNDVIVLDDSTPAIDVVINPSPDTTGVVALEIDHASVTITDAAGNVVFETSAPDIKALQFRFAPNAGTHTLTVERLPDATQAYSRIVSLAELSVSETVPELISSNTLALAQESDYPLNANSPSATVDFAAVEADQFATITASFPGAPVTMQLVEVNENRTLATLYGGFIDGVLITVDSGEYEMVMLNNNTGQQTVANVSLLPASESNFDVLVAQAQGNTTPSTTVAVNNADTTSSCAITVSQSSVNLRSGPGNGYSVLGYGFRGDVFQVGGVSPTSGWLLVGTDAGSGWLSNTTGTMSGNCSNLATYDTPYLEAAAPAVAIQQSFGDDDEYEGEYENENDDGEHEENEHEEHEYEAEDD